MNNIQSQLSAMADTDYTAFHQKLIPTVDPDRIIGVRTPALRTYAKAFAKTEEAKDFLRALPHYYYEENNLHAFVVETIKDFDTALSETEKFLPYIDNWATCDMFLPKVFKKRPMDLMPKIKQWIKSPETYTVRYAVGLLMSLFLDENFSPEYLAMTANIESDEYYVNMMQAWYFATALAKQYDSTIGYFTEKKLSTWVHNKGIQKAVESRRISDEKKAFLRSLKIV